MIKKLFDFEWCDFCSGDCPDDIVAAAAPSAQSNGSGDKKHPKSLCMMGCGPKFVKLCMPSIITFGKKEAEIKHMKEQLNVVEKQIQEYKEMEKARQNLKQLKQEAEKVANVKEKRILQKKK